MRHEKITGMPRVAIRLAAGLCALVLSGAAAADDIDLFTGVQPNGGEPNLLLLLDNAGGWNADASFTCPQAGVVLPINAGKSVGFEQCALHSAVNSIATQPTLLGKVRMGMMMFGTSTNNGAKFRYPATPPSPLPLMDANGISAFQSVIRSIDRNVDGTGNAQVAGGMQEAWAFFSGNRGISGTQYSTPILDSCQRNFVIFLANATNSGKPNDSGQVAKVQPLIDAGANTAQQKEIVISPNKYQSSWGDEWARFMYQTDILKNDANRQNIITYTIAVTDGSNPEYVRLVQSMATNGGGKSFVVQNGDVSGLASALLQILNEVQAVNSVFASVSLPVSVNSQGTYLNQVYIGMFRPDATASPRWQGNLKQYKLGYDDQNELVLQDAKNQPALSGAGTGFLSANAVSFWTADRYTGSPKDGPFAFTTSYSTSLVPSWPTNGYWVNSPASTGGAFDAPDGEVVEKGGAAQMLRAQFLTSQAGRQLYTCNGVGTCPTGGPMPAFDTANSWLTGTNGQAAMNITAANASKLVNWVRGADNNSNEQQLGPGSPVTVRPSIHGDVLHSRPAVVNYGGSTGVVVFYGANDGVFRAINGNQTQGIGTVRPGGELWGFIAPEFHGRLKRLFDNSPQLKLAKTPSGIIPAPLPKEYFFDGATSVYQDTRDPANPKVYLYLTARRGGALIYALDVTNPTAPRFLWKKSKTEIPELGQTWSQPKIIQVRGHSRPVLVMGAGYDTAEDSDPAPGTNTEGRGIVVLDAVNGNVVWAGLKSCSGVSGGTCLPVSTMDRAIAADISVLDRNGDGYVERFYAADVGGNIWRVDLEHGTSNAPATWSVARLATLGGTGNAARKFLYPPDVVATGAFDAVIAGSGDREHPLHSYSTTPGTAYNVVNRLYMLRDPHTTTAMPSTWVPFTEADLFDATNALYDGSKQGYYVTLTNQGEKVVNAPLTVSGITYFGTNTPTAPAPGVCFPDLGTSRGYRISFLTGAGKTDERAVVFDRTVGLPPSPVFGVVQLDKDGKPVTVPVVIGGEKPLNPTPTVQGASHRKRTYWYMNTDRK
ncbi:pilus assembly protein [Imbroritus primus]|uniref:pilus assembly protein n=1 Tax=Imbroritus primus TaxID=3058603 RepID=UPI003D162074